MQVPGRHQYEKQATTKHNVPVQTIRERILVFKVNNSIFHTNYLSEHHEQRTHGYEGNINSNRPPQEQPPTDSD